MRTAVEGDIRSKEGKDAIKREHNQRKPKKESPMSLATMSPNGRVRKSLANEIDRLNQILDGLADGLNEAVALAVQNAVAVAVQQAIQGALSEILNSPAFIEELQKKIAPPVPAPETVPSKQKMAGVKKVAYRVLSWIGAKVKATASACKKCAQAVVDAGKTLLDRIRLVLAMGRVQVVRGLELVPFMVMVAVRLARKFRVPLLVALLIGVGIGIMAFVAGRGVAAVGSGIGAFMTTISIQAGLWLRRMLGFGSRTEPDVPMASAE
jgi:hypothetical protein